MSDKHSKRKTDAFVLKADCALRQILEHCANRVITDIRKKNDPFESIVAKEELPKFGPKTRQDT